MGDITKIAKFLIEDIQRPTEKYGVEFTVEELTKAATVGADVAQEIIDRFESV